MGDEPVDGWVEFDMRTNTSGIGQGSGTRTGVEEVEVEAASTD